LLAPAAEPALVVLQQQEDEAAHHRPDPETLHAFDAATGTRIALASAAP